MTWHKNSTGPRVRNAKKTTLEVDGKPHTFPSHLEALRYLELKRLKEAGIVKEIELQPIFELQPAYRKCCGNIWYLKPHGFSFPGPKICQICKKKMPAIKAITYIADFRITYTNGHVEIEDVKGLETEVFKLKRKMFEYKYPELTLKIVKTVRGAR